MIQPTFTNYEAIAIHHALEILRICTNPEMPISDETKLKALRGCVTPEVLSATAKLQSNLDEARQQQLAAADAEEVQQ